LVTFKKKVDLNETWKFCVNAGFFGRRRDRFTEYQPDRSLEEKFKLNSQRDSIEGVDKINCEKINQLMIKRNPAKTLRHLYQTVL
jgi:hypothetical protein